MSNKYSTVTSKTLAAAVILGSAALSQAAVVNIDFGNIGVDGIQVGLAAAPDADGGETATWNGINTATAAGLLVSTGEISTVGLNFSARGFFNGPVDQELASGHAALFGDYITNRANDNGFDQRTQTITGLTAGNTYDIYIYGQGDNFTDTNNNGGQNLGVTIDGNFFRTSHDGVSGGDGQLVENIEYVVLSAIEADASGEITFDTFNPGGGGTGEFATDPDSNASRFSGINGIQIVGDVVVVPEPSSFALLGLGFVGFALRRRRR